MTTAPTTTTSTPTTAPTDDPKAIDPAAPESKPEGTNEEAAKYRVRAREAEAAKGAAEARVQQLLRREVDRLAGDKLSQAADLLDLGPTTLEGLLDDQGDVDPARVAAATDELLALRPGLGKRITVDFGAGNRGSQVAGSPTGWGEVLGTKRRP